MLLILILLQNGLPTPTSETFAYNHFHNILRLFDILPNFIFTTGETMRDYYL